MEAIDRRLGGRTHSCPSAAAVALVVGKSLCQSAGIVIGEQARALVAERRSFAASWAGRRILKVVAEGRRKGCLTAGC